MVRVKICGVRTLQEARMVKASGAWAMGQVFAPSRRRVEVEDAARINRTLGEGPVRVGVFVNEPREELVRIARECLLDMVQLHGEEEADYWMGLPWPVIKAVRVGPEGFDRSVLSLSGLWGVLFDTLTPGSQGGSGQTFDWRLLQDCRFDCRLGVAGGLNPANVTDVIQALSPDFVDVSSGVEHPQGGKDAERIMIFVEKTKEA